MKKGFTLAETLITIGLIGIVAALTLPSLIKEYQKKVTINQLKKAYTELSEAIKQSEIENGELKYWDFGLQAKDFWGKYLERYIKIGEHKVYDARANGITYYQISGSPETGLAAMWNDGIIIDTLSGYQLFFPASLGSEHERGIHVDLNGFKRPNTFGKDIHSFQLLKDYGLQPYSTDDGMYVPDLSNRNRLKNGPSSCRYYCNSKDGRGMWCTALIILDGWEIRDDYPW